MLLRMPAFRASIVVVGDEILGGFVQDTNSGWLAQRLRLAGVHLERVVTVPDEVDVVAAAVCEELARDRPRVVFTSGGVGSTPDDLTMAAVGRALDKDLVAEPTIDAHITTALRWHASQGVQVTGEQSSAMRRMALVPDGSYLLPGAGEMVPGVAVDVDGGIDADAGATVVVLPGVPGLLRRIVLEGVEPMLLAGRGVPEHVVEIRHSFPESMLNPIFARLGETFPGVHVGSYPGRDCLVRLRGDVEPVEQAASKVRAFLAELEASPGGQRLQEAWRERWSDEQA